MRTKELLRRIVSTDRSNLRYFLKLYFCKETKFSIGKSEEIVIQNKKRKAYNIHIVIVDKEVDGYIILKPMLNGFTLFIPKEDKAVQFTVIDKVNTEKKNCPIEKRGRIEIFKKDISGRFFRGTLGSYLKEKEQWAWL